MNYQYLPPFQQEEYAFGGAHCFIAGDNSFLLSENGTSIVLKNILVSAIESRQLSEDLAFKLYQRGLRAGTFERT